MQTEYLFENGVIKVKFNFNEVQTEMFKKAYGYPEMIPNPNYNSEDPESEEMIPNDMPLEVFWALEHIENMGQRMKDVFNEEKQEELKQCCDETINITPIENENL